MRITTKDVAEFMLEELQFNRLEVVKQRTRHGWIRVAITHNCGWYKKLCSAWTRSRKKYPKERTIIKRQTTIKALERIASGEYGGVYYERIKPFMAEERKRLKLYAADSVSITVEYGEF